MALDYTQIMLAICIGTLAALVYTLRVLVSLEKKVSRLLKHNDISEE
ncbi:MAG: hypothetical protein ABIB43_04850 [archaeon]